MKASASLRFFIIFFSGVFFHHLYLLGSSPCFLYFFKRKLFFLHGPSPIIILSLISSAAWRHWYSGLMKRQKKKEWKKLLPKSNGLQERGVGEDSGHAKKEKKWSSGARIIICILKNKVVWKNYGWDLVNASLVDFFLILN